MALKHEWTDQDIQLLTEIYQKHGSKASRVAHEHMPHRTRKAIQNRAYRLGITERRDVKPRDVKNEMRLEEWWEKYSGPSLSLSDTYDQVRHDYHTLKGYKEGW